MTTIANKRRPSRRKDGPVIIKSGKLNRTRSGEVFDRSTALKREDAERMQAALKTLPGFVDVEAISTKHASPDGKTWFVRWHRAEYSVPCEISAMQQTRAERAVYQAPEMEPFLVPGDAPEIPRRWILHRFPDTDFFTLYLVTFNSCTCPDMEYRGRKLSACKHILFLNGHLREQNRKRTQADRDLDAKTFGW